MLNVQKNVFEDHVTMFLRDYELSEDMACYCPEHKALDQHRKLQYKNDKIKKDLILNLKNSNLIFKCKFINWHNA